MSIKLFVGGLPFRTTEEAIQEAFSKAGNVLSVKIITDKMTGRSRGFGFVEFDSKSEAETAIEMYNGKDFEGRNIIVNEARPMEDRPKRFNSNRD